MADKKLDELYRLLREDPSDGISNSIIITPNDSQLEAALHRPKDSINSWNTAAQKHGAATSAAALLLNKDGTVEQRPEIVEPTDAVVAAFLKMRVPPMMKDFMAAFPPMPAADRLKLVLGGPASSGKLYGLTPKHKGQRREP